MVSEKRLRESAMEGFWQVSRLRAGVRAPQERGADTLSAASRLFSTLFGSRNVTTIKVLDLAPPRENYAALG